MHLLLLTGFLLIFRTGKKLVQATRLLHKHLHLVKPVHSVWIWWCWKPQQRKSIHSKTVQIGLARAELKIQGTCLPKPSDLGQFIYHAHLWFTVKMQIASFYLVPLSNASLPLCFISQKQAAHRGEKNTTHLWILTPLYSLPAACCQYLKNEQLSKTMELKILAYLRDEEKLWGIAGSRAKSEDVSRSSTRLKRPCVCMVGSQSSSGREGVLLESPKDRQTQ